MAVLDGTRTVKEVANMVYGSINNLSEKLKRQHELGNIHIAAWKTTKGRVARCYMCGPGEDAPPPPPTTNSIRYKNFLARMTAYQREIYLKRRALKARAIKADKVSKKFFKGVRDENSFRN